MVFNFFTVCNYVSSYLLSYESTFEGTVYVYSADVLPYNVLYSTCTVQLYTSVYNIVVALQSLLLKKTKIMPIGCHVYKHETW